MTHLIKHPQPGGGVGCLPEKDVCITSGHLSLLWPFFGSRIALLWPQYISRKKNQLREAGISVFKTICPKAHSRSLKSLLSKEAWPLISSLCALHTIPKLTFLSKNSILIKLYFLDIFEFLRQNWKIFLDILSKKVSNIWIFVPKI